MRHPCNRGWWTLALPEAAFPPGIFVYVQGVVFAYDVMATRVEDFVLDVTVEPKL